MGNSLINRLFRSNKSFVQSPKKINVTISKHTLYTKKKNTTDNSHFSTQPNYDIVNTSDTWIENHFPTTAIVHRPLECVYRICPAYPISQWMEKNRWTMCVDRKCQWINLWRIITQNPLCAHGHCFQMKKRERMSYHRTCFFWSLTLCACVYMCYYK